MAVVNSACGCAAGKMRPAVVRAMQHANLPDRSVTVFAGQDREATEKARYYFTGYQPSSPSIGILRDGKLVYFMERYQIETRDAGAIAAVIIDNTVASSPNPLGGTDATVTIPVISVMKSDGDAFRHAAQPDGRRSSPTITRRGLANDWASTLRRRAWKTLSTRS